MGPEAEASGRRWRWLVTVLVLLALVSPVVRDRDSFPLSTYPMYATTRPEVVAFATVVGRDGEGQGVDLSLPTIARTDDALIGQARVRQAIAAGRAADLCAEVADRAPAAATQVEVVTERHDVVALATGEPSLVDRVVHATCEAPT
jgi:hypothetical protein